MHPPCPELELAKELTIDDASNIMNELPLPALM